MYRKMCIGCGAQQNGGLECFGCGATALELQDKPAAPKRTKPWYAGGKRERYQLSAELARATGGEMPRRGLIVVTGPGGAGKTTLVARAALELQRMGQRVAVLDAEMGDELAAYTWKRAGATARERAKLERYTPEHGTWDKLASKASHAPVIVVDSLQEWQEEADKAEVADDCSRRGRLAQNSLVFVISHYARAGHALGSVKTDHRGDALIIVSASEIYVEKCTWGKAHVTTARES